jgi:hypothetical protein
VRGLEHGHRAGVVVRLHLHLHLGQDDVGRCHRKDDEEERWCACAIELPSLPSIRWCTARVLSHEGQWMAMPGVARGMTTREKTWQRRRQGQAGVEKNFLRRQGQEWRRIFFSCRYGARKSCELAFLKGL